MARMKPKAVVVSSLEQATGAPEELCVIRRAVTAITDQMNADIDQAKAQAAGLAEPLLARQKELESALMTFGQLSRAELFAKRKSLETPFGAIGFRKSTRLVTLAKVKLSDVLEKLKQFAFVEAIKVKESVDREAMRDWPDERLELVGMERKSADEFFIELKAEDLGRKG